jgi:hypothetical protein
MAGTVNNILYGPCTVAVDAGVDVGYTTGGVAVRKTRDFVDVEADQLTGIAVKKVSMEKMFVAFTMLESTLVNLQNAFGEGADAGSGDLQQRNIP